MELTIIKLDTMVPIKDVNEWGLSSKYYINATIR